MSKAVARPRVERSIVTVAIRDTTFEVLSDMTKLGFGVPPGAARGAPGVPEEIASLWLYRWTRHGFEPWIESVPEGPRYSLDIPVEQVTLERLQVDQRKQGAAMDVFCASIVDRFAAVLIEGRRPLSDQ
jgi:hypothetical protein